MACLAAEDANFREERHFTPCVVLLGRPLALRKGKHWVLVCIVVQDLGGRNQQHSVKWLSLHQAALLIIQLLTDTGESIQFISFHELTCRTEQQALVVLLS